MRRSLLSWLALAPLMVLNVFPFAVMLLTALKPRDEVLAYPPRWLPTRLALGNFAEMWTATNFGPALVNSLEVAAGATIVTLALAVPFAYAMTRHEFAGRGALETVLLVVQMVSPIVLIIGLFRLAVFLHLVDTHLALVQGCSTLVGRLYWVPSATRPRRCVASDRKGDSRA